MDTNKFKEIIKLRNENKTLFECERLPDGYYWTACSFTGLQNQLKEEHRKGLNEMNGFKTIDINKTTNVYERLLVKLFNEYLTEILIHEELDNIEEEIHKLIINNELTDKDRLKEMTHKYVMESFENYNPYIKIFRYRTDDEQHKYNTYFNFISDITNEEVDQYLDDGAPIPTLARFIQQRPGEEHATNLFAQAIYEKMKIDIEAEDDILEFTTEDDGITHVLLIKGSML